MRIVDHFEPLLVLEGVERSFDTAEGRLSVLQGINLQFYAGEMVAIVGASGSGKSTLLNILGCLDLPTAGRYRVAGQSVAGLDQAARARLRREYFGFIFQKYHLIPFLDALANVELPAVYADKLPSSRRSRALALLERLQLSNRLHHMPHQLSGGQQQRVSVARALMNGGQVVLADEPTGALDAESGRVLLEALHELHRQGHLVILVTHDAQLAACADRVISVHDGRVIEDRRLRTQPPHIGLVSVVEPRSRSLRARWYRFRQFLTMGLQTLVARWLRTLLAMLGIMIGIAAVVTIDTLGEGARLYTVQAYRGMIEQRIGIYKGTGPTDERAQGVKSFGAEDLKALRGLSGVEQIAPLSYRSADIRYLNKKAQAEVLGTDADYFSLYNATRVRGRLLSAQDLSERAPVAVVSEALRSALDIADREIGQILLVGPIPVRVVGVVKMPDQMRNRPPELLIMLPYTTLGARLSGSLHIDQFLLRVRDAVDARSVETKVSALLAQRHGLKDFYTENYAEWFNRFNKDQKSRAFLLTAVSFIALVVGGVGLMSLMLVSVSERTQEIGIRLAIGARQADILRQFLLESALICLIGAVLGAALSIGIVRIAGLYKPDWPLQISGSLTALACIGALAMGILFGYWPARRAAQLDPIAALARE